MTQRRYRSPAREPSGYACSISCEIHFALPRAVGERLTPGQTLWRAIAIDEQLGYRKPTRAMRQVPGVLTLTNQADIADLAQPSEVDDHCTAVLGARGTEAYAQGSVLTCSDLAVLVHHRYNRVTELIHTYAADKGATIPRRGNLHDIGRTVSHKRMICRKAYLKGNPTPVIARETCHSPDAIDQYMRDFARVYFATVQRGMRLEETIFAIQRPR